MSDYTAELLTLSTILNEKKTYKEALFKIFQEQNLSKNSKHIVSINVAGVLRHYFCLSYECLELLDFEKNSNEHILSLIALYVLRYQKKVSKEIVCSSFKSAWMNVRALGDLNKTYEIIYNASLNPFAIDEKVKKSPVFYNSLILEMPDFLLKRFNEIYSSRVSLSISSSLHKKDVYFFGGINEDKEELSHNFKCVSFDDFTLYYTKKNMTIDEIKKLHLYPFSYLNSLAFSHLDLPVIAPKILTLNPLNCFDLLHLHNKISSCVDYKLDCSSQDDISYRNFEDTIRFFNLKNVSVIKSDLNYVKTSFETNAYDYVILHGHDLKIGLARSQIGVLPSLSEHDIKRSYQRQCNELEESSYFVKDGGYLIFINNTLINEESYDVLSSFLKAHKDFYVIKEQIVLPQILDNDGGFYTILRKRGKDD